MLIKLDVLQSLYEQISDSEIVKSHSGNAPSHSDSDSSLSGENNSSREPGLAPSFGSYTESETSTPAAFDPQDFEVVWETTKISEGKGRSLAARP